MKWSKRSWKHRYSRKTYRSPEWFAEHAKLRELERLNTELAEKIRWTSLSTEQQEREIWSKKVDEELKQAMINMHRQWCLQLYGDGSNVINPYGDGEDNG